jgi:CheY-like chemotaxis protein
MESIPCVEEHQGKRSTILPRICGIFFLLQTAGLDRKRRQMSWPPDSRVFVVDDEHLIATSLVAILKLKGFSAKSFTCAREALKEASLQAPDLLISDVVMPDISGIDLAILMTAQYPACKVLLFSGQATTSDLLQDARDKGYNFRLLSKPVHPTALLSEVETLAQQPERMPEKHLPRRVGALAEDSASFYRVNLPFRGFRIGGLKEVVSKWIGH